MTEFNVDNMSVCVQAYYEDEDAEQVYARKHITLDENDVYVLARYFSSLTMGAMVVYPPYLAAAIYKLMVMFTDLGLDITSVRLTEDPKPLAIRHPAE